MFFSNNYWLIISKYTDLIFINKWQPLYCWIVIKVYLIICFKKKRLPLWLYHKRWKTLWYPNVIEVIFVNLFQDHFIFIKHFLEIIKIHAQIIFFCHKFSIFNNIDIFLGHSYCQFCEQKCLLESSKIPCMIRYCSTSIILVLSKKRIKFYQNNAVKLNVLLLVFSL